MAVESATWDDDRHVWSVALATGTSVEAEVLVSAVGCLKSRMEGTSWTMTDNYFRSPTGKIVTQWPSGNLVYRLLTTRVLGTVSESTRRRLEPAPWAS